MQKMKLLTKAILDKMPKLYTTEDIPVGEKEVIVKFFTPDSNWTWFVVEGEDVLDDDGNAVDYRMFGLVHGHEKEWGYFLLSELRDATGPMGLHIERDYYFTGKV
jgi:hypothetical protein